jgi:hypothetical protein
VSHQGAGVCVHEVAPAGTVSQPVTVTAPLALHFAFSIAGESQPRRAQQSQQNNESGSKNVSHQSLLLVVLKNPTPDRLVELQGEG